MQLTRRPVGSELRFRKEGEFFNSLARDAMRDLDDIAVPLDCPANAVLFQEWETPTRLLILLDGCAKISMNTSTGRKVILRIARPTELLALSPILTGRSHELTAETLHRCRIASIPRQMFLDFLTRHPDVYQCVARELSLERSRACARMRIIEHSSLAAARLAMFLLEWSVGSSVIDRKARFTVYLTHEEIGECLGAARETVTRAFADLKQRELIDIHGSVVIISNRFALEDYAHRPHPALDAAARSQSGRVGRPVAAIQARAAREMNRHVRHPRIRVPELR